MWLVGSKPIRSKLIMLQDQSKANNIFFAHFASLQISMTVGVNEFFFLHKWHHVRCIIRCHLSATPNQFSIFEDEEGWQPHSYSMPLTGVKENGVWHLAWRKWFFQSNRSHFTFTLNSTPMTTVTPFFAKFLLTKKRRRLKGNVLSLFTNWIQYCILYLLTNMIDIQNEFLTRQVQGRKMTC